MTYKKVDQLLKNYSEINMSIKDIEIRMKISGIKENYLTDMPGDPNRNITSGVETELYKIERLKNEKLYLEIKKECIENILNILDEVEYKMIKDRYINKLTNTVIANKMYMSDASVSLKFKRILTKLVPYALRFNLIEV